MSIIFRALVYASLFVGFLFIYLPGRLLSWTGIHRPASMAWPQIAGLIVATTGAIIALWCVCAFVWIGKGAPAPFDPPRRLVVRGPYRRVRNPMYLGAAFFLGGVGLFYHSAAVALYGLALLAVAHLIVVLYEEPALRRSFGAQYEEYCRRVPRWRPLAKLMRETSQAPVSSVAASMHSRESDRAPRDCRVTWKLSGDRMQTLPSFACPAVPPIAHRLFCLHMAVTPTPMNCVQRIPAARLFGFCRQRKERWQKSLP